MTMMHGVFVGMDLKSFSICHLTFFICHFNHRSRLEGCLSPRSRSGQVRYLNESFSNDQMKNVK